MTEQLSLLEFSARELHEFGKEAAETFHLHKGYDTAEFLCLKVFSDCIIFEFQLGDYFQTHLDYSKRYRHGYVDIELREVDLTLPQFRAEVAAWPNREQRELRVLARQLADISPDKMSSLAGQEFAAKIRAESVALDNLLEAPAAVPF